MKYASPTIILLRDHYQRLGLLNFDSSDKGWSADQVLDLCEKLNISQDELACLICLNPKKFRTQMKSKRGIPPETSLLFVIILQWFMERTTGIVSEPAVPIGLLKFDPQ